jgi:hypothetical protein
MPDGENSVIDRFSDANEDMSKYSLLRMIKNAELKTNAGTAKKMETNRAMHYWLCELNACFASPGFN